MQTPDITPEYITKMRSAGGQDLLFQEFSLTELIHPSLWCCDNSDNHLSFDYNYRLPYDASMNFMGCSVCVHSCFPVQSLKLLTKRQTLGLHI